MNKNDIVSGFQELSVDFFIALQKNIEEGKQQMYYETHGKKYDFDCYDAPSRNDAMQKGMSECAN